MALKLGTLSVDINADTSDLRKADKEVKRTADGMTRAFKRVGGAIAAAVSIEAARRILLVADNMRVLERRLVRFTGTAARAEKTMRALTRTASETGSTIANTVSVFERFSLVRDSIGATNDDIIQLTDTVSKLGALGGSSGEEISNALRQMSQSFSGGIVRAEEFNSIIENTPEIIKAIAREMGLTMGQVRARMLEGKLTAQDVFQAMKDAAEQTNIEFAAMPKSITMVAQAIKNELAVAIGNVDDGLGFSAAISNALQSFADLIAEINATSAAQEELNKLLGVGSGPPPRNVRDLRRGRGGSSPELTAAQEINKLITERERLESRIGQRVRGTLGRDTERRKGLREELAIINERIAALKAESAEARRVAEIRAGIEATVTDESAAPTPAAVGEVSSADLKRLERVGQLGEGDLGKINREAQERREFVLSQEQLTADQRRELLGKIREQQISETNAHNDRLLQIEVTAQQQRQALAVSQQTAALAGLVALGDQANSLLAASGQEGTTIAKAIFLTQKAIQIATILAATEVAAANASAVAALAGPVPFFATQAAIRATGLASAALVAGLAVGETFGGGRQFGGSVSPRLAHPINEAGTPEILDMAGKQFLLPTGKGGTISPLSGGGGGGPTNITIISNGTPQTVTGTQVTRGETAIMIDDKVTGLERRINASLATGRGDSAAALRRGFKVDRNLR